MLHNTFIIIFSLVFPIIISFYMYSFKAQDYRIKINYYNLTMWLLSYVKEREIGRERHRETEREREKKKKTLDMKLQ